jgi:hypothetical protein
MQAYAAIIATLSLNVPELNPVQSGSMKEGRTGLFAALIAPYQNREEMEITLTRTIQ